MVSSSGRRATCQEIVWSGAAFFTADHHRITDLWVLVDTDAVKRLLGAGVTIIFRSAGIVARAAGGGHSCQSPRWIRN
jgi:hypothetical protein